MWVPRRALLAIPGPKRGYVSYLVGAGAGVSRDVREESHRTRRAGVHFTMGYQGSTHDPKSDTSPRPPEIAQGRRENTCMSDPVLSTCFMWDTVAVGMPK
ncbi:hypothetical protein J6590_000260 [Homalodisca vitripennis]|nr:hypothetical protein J6590_000260 [Homalodisca vitripennis]